MCGIVGIAGAGRAQLRGRSQEANQFWCAFTSSGRADKTSERRRRLTSWSVADMPLPFALIAFSSSSDAAKFLLHSF